MTITSASTIIDIRTTGVAPVLPSATDLTAWTSITLPGVITDYESAFKVGLFGYDLSSFFTYCETATTECDSTVYNATYFDGWSIGAYVPVDDYSNDLQTDLILGICFEDTFACLGFYTSATVDTADLDGAWNGIMSAAYTFAATTPTAANAAQEALATDAGAVGYGFIPGWFSAPTIYDDTITTLVKFNNFQRVNDYYKIELADTTTVWSVSSATGDDDDNTDTPVTYASSAALAIPAAIALAALSAF
jgi:hypothetical protein